MNKEKYYFENNSYKIDSFTKVEDDKLNKQIMEEKDIIKNVDEKDNINCNSNKEEDEENERDYEFDNLGYNQLFMNEKEMNKKKSEPTESPIKEQKKFSIDMPDFPIQKLHDYLNDDLINALDDDCPSEPLKTTNFSELSTNINNTINSDLNNYSHNSSKNNRKELDSDINHNNPEVFNFQNFAHNTISFFPNPQRNSNKINDQYDSKFMSIKNNNINKILPPSSGFSVNNHINCEFQGSQIDNLYGREQNEKNVKLQENKHLEFSSFVQDNNNNNNFDNNLQSNNNNPLENINSNANNNRMLNNINNEKNKEVDESQKDEKSKKPFEVRAGDWSCMYCFNLNFAFRLKCNRCGIPKDFIFPKPSFNNQIQIQQNFHNTINYLSLKNNPFRNVLPINYCNEPFFSSLPFSFRNNNNNIFRNSIPNSIQNQNCYGNIPQNFTQNNLMCQRNLLLKNMDNNLFNNNNNH